MSLDSHEENEKGSVMEKLTETTFESSKESTSDVKSRFIGDSILRDSDN